jgi:hypothetical protein
MGLSDLPTDASRHAAELELLDEADKRSQVNGGSVDDLLNGEKSLNQDPFRLPELKSPGYYG